MTHFEGFQRGVLDLRDVIFFASVIGFALFTTGRDHPQPAGRLGSSMKRNSSKRCSTPPAA